MLEQEDKNWKELCSAAIEARDPDKLLEIVQRLNNALKREEQVSDSQENRIGRTFEEAQC
ncbi:MAG: hypothetical protein WBM24_19570 [Candidatus Sulfotelmatobacter sp.]